MLISRSRPPCCVLLANVAAEKRASWSKGNPFGQAGCQALPAPRYSCSQIPASAGSFSTRPRGMGESAAGAIYNNITRSGSRGTAPVRRLCAAVFDRVGSCWGRVCNLWVIWVVVCEVAGGGWNDLKIFFYIHQNRAMPECCAKKCKMQTKRRALT